MYSFLTSPASVEATISSCTQTDKSETSEIDLQVFNTILKIKLQIAEWSFQLCNTTESELKTFPKGFSYFQRRLHFSIFLD
jgi:hypothetical protein